MQLGHVISRLRNEKKISQKQLAYDLHVSSGLVGLWETNKRLPSLECFISLIDYFSVSADLLLERDRKLTPSEYNIHPTTLSSASVSEKKIIETFIYLNEDNQDILIGEAKKLLKQQRIEEKNGISKIKEAK